MYRSLKSRFLFFSVLLIPTIFIERLYVYTI